MDTNYLIDTQEFQDNNMELLFFGGDIDINKNPGYNISNAYNINTINNLNNINIFNKDNSNNDNKINNNYIMSGNDNKIKEPKLIH